ncbi:MAG: hypothetical protein KDA68_11955 [Planctomycetaceae bacterium]|nr:hypothetical protein [Planctomycetaceae bacterium]
MSEYVSTNRSEPTPSLGRQQMADSRISTVRRFYSVEEFSRQSGLSPATIRRRIKDGQLPSYQPGGPRTKVLIPASAWDSVAVTAPNVPLTSAPQPEAPVEATSGAAAPPTRPVGDASPLTHRPGPPLKWKRGL